MARKKKPPRLTREQKAIYSRLVPIVRKLVIENEANRDGYGKRNKLQIVWSEAFPRPVGFPLGRLVSATEGQRITEHLACTVLDWCEKMCLTKDTAKSIYALRHYALVSLAKLERNLFNMDEKMLEELLDKNSEETYSECSEQNKQEN